MGSFVVVMMRSPLKAEIPALSKQRADGSELCEEQARENQPIEVDADTLFRSN
jgi:hypothetical protein